MPPPLNTFPAGPRRDSRGTLRFADERGQLTMDRKTYVYYSQTQMIAENVAALGVRADLGYGGWAVESRRARWR